MIYKIPETTSTLELIGSTNILLNYDKRKYLFIGNSIMLSDDAAKEAPRILQQDIFKARLLEDDAIVGLVRNRVYRIPQKKTQELDYLALGVSHRTLLGSFNGVINKTLYSYYFIINHNKHKNCKYVVIISQCLDSNHNVTINEDIEMSHYKIL